VIVDVSRKASIRREAIAVVKVDCRVSSVDFISGAMAVKSSWRFLPFLHPIPIAEVSPACIDDYVGVRVVAEERTGVEMDALLGALTLGLSALASRNPQGGIKELKVVEKAKGTTARTPLSPCSFENIEPKISEVVEGAGIWLTRASGCILLREGTLKLIEEGGVEKGDVVSTTKAISLMAVKRAWELIPWLPQPRIYGANVSIELRGGGLCLDLTVKSAGSDASIEAMFGAGLGLLNVWDMVKKYEKDELGNYPYTRIVDLTVVERRTVV